MSAKFQSVAELCTALGGNRPLGRVLIANNGLAAVKGIRSLKSWMYDHIGDSDAVRIEVMATPDDLGVDAEYIRMADHCVEVPGGSNGNNYANVDLIIATALQTGCDAVYPGWGHASENPALPRECEKTRGKVTFLGPSESAMFALGDKIASTIIAQSNGVPTAPWSGQAITLPPGSINIDSATYDRAFIHTAEQCQVECDRIGYPVMIKASEGGGGKGIRKVLRSEDVATAFRAVKEEVKNCHVFAMRMLCNVRHLEVQLLGDKYGSCIAVRTRDCSVQRRHQKIIEEGPVVGVDPNVVLDMERAAIRLAQAVGYHGAGTVEYMYDRDHGTFSFLELNPRLQVEHPVSEIISGVNLPAALLCVCMGMPLHRIPEVRQYYGEQPYGDSLIDFNARQPLPPRGHAIAVRITAEDVDEGFRPTTGAIDEISFRNSRECWGYFSVGSGGGVHQFADSQFGHIFSMGETREDARRGMVLALRGVTVRGEIRTSTAYAIELLERPEFRDLTHHTAWLDGLLEARKKEPKSVDVFPALSAAAIHRFKRFREGNMSRYVSALRAGHTPTIDYLSNRKTEPFVLGSKKFICETAMLNASSEYAIRLNQSTLVVPCRETSNGGLQLTLAGRTVVAYCEEEPGGLRITINGRATTFTSDEDPTMLRSSVPGRLVRFLVPDGGRVKEGADFAEVEVMKMILTLKCSVSGKLSLRATAGCTLNVGKLLAEVEPDDPSSVSRPLIDDSPWPERLRVVSLVPGIDRTEAITRVRTAVDKCWNVMQGYSFDDGRLNEDVNKLIEVLPSLCLSSVSLRALNRPFLGPPPENVHIDVVPASPVAVSSTTAATASMTPPDTSMGGDSPPPSAGSKSVGGGSNNNSIAGLSSISVSTSADNTPIFKLRALVGAFIGEYLRIERHFDGRAQRDEIVDRLKEHFADSLQDVFRIDFAHHHNAARQKIIQALLGHLEQNHSLMLQCKDLLEDLAALQGTTQHGTVLLQARFQLRSCKMPSFDDRKQSLTRALEEGQLERIVKTSVGFDLMTSMMFDGRAQQELTPLVLELFIRRAYFGVCDVTDLDIFRSRDVASWCGYWRFEQSVHDHETVPLFPTMTLRAAQSGVALDESVRSDTPVECPSLGPGTPLSSGRASSRPRNDTVSGSAAAAAAAAAVGGSQQHGTPDSTQGGVAHRPHLYAHPDAGRGFFALYNDEVEMNERIGSFFELIAGEAQQEETVAVIFVQVRDHSRGADCIAPFHSLVTSNKQRLGKANLRHVTFVVVGTRNRKQGPSLFTLSQVVEYAENVLYRDLMPTTVERLELQRLSNYALELFPTPHRAVHVYVARPANLKRDAGPLERRLFVRMYISSGDFGVPAGSTIGEAECSHVLGLVISSVEFARSDKRVADTAFNHAFFNMIDVGLDVTTMVSTLRRVAAANAKMLFKLGFREMEMRFRAHTPEGTLPYRVVLRNLTGFTLQIECYVELVSPEDGSVSLQRATHVEDLDGLVSEVLPRDGGEGASSSTPKVRPHNSTLASPEIPARLLGAARQPASSSSEGLDSPAQQQPPGLHRLTSARWTALKTRLTIRGASALDGVHTPSQEDNTVSPVSVPYPLPSSTQLRRLQAQAQQTTFAPDWMVLIEVCLQQQWKEFLSHRGLPVSVVPPVIFSATPMRASAKFLSSSASPWSSPKATGGADAGGSPVSTPAAAASAEDSSTSSPLVEGSEACGMLIWRCRMAPPCYFNPLTGACAERTVVVVANDITFQSGSFSVAEDTVFKAASVYARQNGLPLIYISANSGARLGLSNEVKSRFRVALRGDAVDYLYLTKRDYDELTAAGVLVNTCPARGADGEERLRIVDIIGKPGECIGVENLQGSALIAGEMSLNYASVPTLSIATGRTVGIGAYLVRLGRRVIQTQNSPIILTGAAALNRLLGKEVYTGNSQLGGNAIMQPNGVSHWGAKDDLDSINIALRWLSFVPVVTSPHHCRPHTLTLLEADPVDRDVTFYPPQDETYDPRLLVTGSGTTTGLFDRGSWMESLSDWAKAVVVGRATLGGLPCGVVLVETRLTKKFDPADPADPSSTATYVSQAGQVWFPDSARKTADALEDFHRERLPCFVLANWRGFSGGMRDMYDEVLKFGASIVDNLRVYTAPVFIYIPPFGELRGGAWVVVDPVINHNGCVQMFCDSNARGGILEPAGVVEIKFRDADVMACMRRTSAALQEKAVSDPAGAKKLEAQLLPVYNDVAIAFADLHDTPGRMKATGCVVDVVPWKNSRRVFHEKLLRRLADLNAAHTLVRADVSGTTTIVEGLARVESLFCAAFAQQQSDSTASTAAAAWGNDQLVHRWLTSAQGKAALERQRRECRLSSIASLLVREVDAEAATASEEDDTGVDAADDAMEVIARTCRNLLQHRPKTQTALQEALLGGGLEEGH